MNHRNQRSQKFKPTEICVCMCLTISRATFVGKGAFPNSYSNTLLSFAYFIVTHVEINCAFEF